MASRAPGSAKSPEKKKGFLRTAILALFLFAVIGLYLFRLVNMQLLNPDGSMVIGGERIIISRRIVSIRASRGMIRDRSGMPLVKNDTRYQLILDASTFPADDEAANALLSSLFSLFDDNWDALRVPSLPIEEGFADGRYLYFLRTENLSQLSSERFRGYLETLGLPDTVKAGELLDAMFVRYHLRAENPDGTAGELLYDYRTSCRIAAVRYDLETLTFKPGTPYLLCDDAPLDVITPVREQKLRGADFIVKTGRIYCYPGYASHLLGRTGPIQASQADYYASLGYPMDAIVGIDGIEAAFEEQLRGVDGEMVIEEDQYGNILSQTVTKEAVPGRDVWLTISIDLQMQAEDALAANIAHIVENALSSGEELSGEDANAGALIVVDPNTAEVLASASYPTFDLSTYSADFAALSADPDKPFVNRAFMGTYAPGSTFKVGVAAAAMENGIIGPDTLIDTQGVYTYYEDYQPRCWLFTRTGLSHGKINVVQALCDSCNWFFFDVGRQLGITKMADYMSSLGLGQATGVELPESKGILSSPAYTASKKMPWTGAATLQTAIGQGYNAYTPLQLSMYLSAVVNGGSRYRAHLYLGSTQTYSDVPPVPTEPDVLGHAVISEETRNTLIRAMKEVAENGSATRVFRGYGVPVGAKTGTAEGDSDASANGVFAAFAPADDPEILCVSVIENGASGTSAGLCVRDVFDYWFSHQ
ncbi:MAG: hypothetical protein MJ175_02010 [Clostridia bacterium]|nr:hypothetical protein [Clostridia bacterium]